MDERGYKGVKSIDNDPMYAYSVFGKWISCIGSHAW